MTITFGKPVSVHSRYSWRDCFQMVRESDVNRVVFHWYSGPLSVLHDFVAEGYFASATPAIEYGAEHARAIGETPLQNLMLETDAPVVYKWGTESAYSAEPSHTTDVLKAVAELKGIEADVVAQKTAENAIIFFELSDRGVE